MDAKKIFVKDFEFQPLGLGNSVERAQPSGEALRGQPRAVIAQTS